MTKGKTIAAWLGGGVMGILVVGGLAHMPTGLRLMARLGVVCPALALTPEAATELRAEGLKSLRGTAPAPVRYAVGLELGVDDEAAAERWATARGAVCARKTRGFVLLTCARPFDDGSEQSVVALDGHGRVLSVDITKKVGAVAEVARRFHDRRDRMAVAFGAPTDQAGDVDAFATGAQASGIETAVVRYRFSDYLALLQATRLPSGLYVREQYQLAL
jgi:hypothetical protein